MPLSVKVLVCQHINPILIASLSRILFNFSSSKRHTFPTVKHNKETYQLPPPHTTTMRFSTTFIALVAALISSGAALPAPAPVALAAPQSSDTLGSAISSLTDSGSSDGTVSGSGNGAGSSDGDGYDFPSVHCMSFNTNNSSQRCCRQWRLCW